VNHYRDWLALQPSRPRTGVVYIAVRVIVYIVALVLMVLIYGTKQRGLFIAPPIALIGGAGTWYLLGDSMLVDGQRRLITAGGVGLLLGELTWAMGYWNVLAPVGGAGLWLAFYVLSGVVEHGASGTLDPRIAREYAVVAAIGAAVILTFARPWSA
jgi:hypothetical protein